MKLIPYYEKDDIVPLPEIKEIKETRYEDVDLKEFNVYFVKMFAVKDTIIIGVNYIFFYQKEVLKERFNFISPIGLKDNVYYPVPVMIEKLIRDSLKEY